METKPDGFESLFVYICKRQNGVQCLVFLCLISQQDSCLNDLVWYTACGEKNIAEKKKENFHKAQKL